MEDNTNNVLVTKVDDGFWQLQDQEKTIIGFISLTENGYEHSMGNASYRSLKDSVEAFEKASRLGVGGPPPAPSLNPFEQAVLQLIYCEPNAGITYDGIYNSTHQWDRSFAHIKGIKKAVQKLEVHGLVTRKQKTVGDGVPYGGKIHTVVFYPAPPSERLDAILPFYGIEVVKPDAIKGDATVDMPAPADSDDPVDLQVACDEVQNVYPHMISLVSSGANGDIVSDGMIFLKKKDHVQLFIEKLQAPGRPANGTPLTFTVDEIKLAFRKWMVEASGIPYEERAAVELFVRYLLTTKEAWEPRRPVSPQELRENLIQWLVHNYLHSGVRFMTPDEWKAKGESRYAAAALHLEFRGALYDLLHYGISRSNGGDLEGEFYRVVERLGYEFRVSSDTTAHFYPLGTAPAAKQVERPRPAQAQPRRSNVLAALLAFLV